MPDRTQVISRPHGISAFDSAQIQAPPDRAQIELAVTRLANKPDAAFRDAHEASAKAFASLGKLGVRAPDVATAHTTLQRAFEGYGESRNSSAIAP